MYIHIHFALKFAHTMNTYLYVMWLTISIFWMHHDYYSVIVILKSNHMGFYVCILSYRFGSFFFSILVMDYLNLAAMELFIQQRAVFM